MADYLVTAIYENNNQKWQLSNLLVGPYSLFGKTAISYYNIARSNYDKSYLIDAANTLQIAKECIRPAGNLFHFEKEKEFEEFYEKVTKEVQSKYQLPLSLENIPTKPKIFNIFPQDINEGFFPMICYLSNIELYDSTSLANENYKIRKEVDKIFNGININKKYVFYRAYNEMPAKNRPVRYYGFTELGAAN